MCLVSVYCHSSEEFFCMKILPYFFGYKTEFFSFQNNPKDLELSCKMDPKDLDLSCKMDPDLWDCKMDLDLWDCLGRVKLVL